MEVRMLVSGKAVKYSQTNPQTTSRECEQELELVGQRVKQLSRQPQRAALLSSALRTILDAFEDCSLDKLPDKAASGTQIVVKLLEETEAKRLHCTKTDPLENSRRRGVAARERLVQAEGGCLSGPVVAQLLGVSREAVNKRRISGKLIALSTSKRGYLYPGWQFIDRDILPGLSGVLAVLDEEDPWMQASFMLSPNTWLEGEASPLDLLRQRRLEEVMTAARAYGEQGAA